MNNAQQRYIELTNSLTSLLKTSKEPDVEDWEDDYNMFIGLKAWFDCATWDELEQCLNYPNGERELLQRRRKCDDFKKFMRIRTEMDKLKGLVNL